MTPTQFSADDADSMAKALRLAERGLWTTHPNPRVGCVIVRDGRIVGEGWHRQAGGPHAEVDAVLAAGDAAFGATAYVTLEPCCHHGRTPPCTDALIAAGVGRVVAAMRDPNPLVAGEGLARLRAAGIAAECGLLAAEAEALNAGFCKRMRSGRPWVVSKLAMSLDGRTAMASGESRWITGADARRDVHRWRARSSAIVTGIDTVLADDPTLTVRLPQEEVWRQPNRIVLDSGLRMPVSAQLLNPPTGTVVLGTRRAECRADTLRAAGADVHLLPESEDGRLDLGAVFDLFGDLAFNEVFVEAGAVLNGALLTAGLVDEWLVYLAPCILGHRGRGLFHLPDLERMQDRYELKLIDSRQIGPDLRLTFRKGG